MKKIILNILIFLFFVNANYSESIAQDAGAVIAVVKEEHGLTRLEITKLEASVVNALRLQTQQLGFDNERLLKMEEAVASAKARQEVELENQKILRQAILDYQVSPDACRAAEAALRQKAAGIGAKSYSTSMNNAVGDWERRNQEQLSAFAWAGENRRKYKEEEGVLANADIKSTSLYEQGEGVTGETSRDYILNLLGPIPEDQPIDNGSIESNAMIAERGSLSARLDLASDSLSFIASQNSPVLAGEDELRSQNEILIDEVNNRLAPEWIAEINGAGDLENLRALNRQTAVSNKLLLDIKNYLEKLLAIEATESSINSREYYQKRIPVFDPLIAKREAG